jgi:hypothetical protein
MKAVLQSVQIEEETLKALREASERTGFKQYRIMTLAIAEWIEKHIPKEDK